VAGLANTTGGAEAFREGDDMVLFAGKPLANAILGILCITAGVLCSCALWGWGQPSALVMIAASVSALIFAFAATLALRAASRGRRTMVAIGFRGIFDWRLSDDWIPWSGIRSIVPLPLTSYWSREYLDVQLEPEFARAVRLNILSRINLAIGLFFWSRRLRVVPIGVEGGIEPMKQALDCYFPQWRQSRN
jgi:hypothetical protein